MTEQRAVANKQGSKESSSVLMSLMTSPASRYTRISKSSTCRPASPSRVFTLISGTVRLQYNHAVLQLLFRFLSRLYGTA